MKTRPICLLFFLLSLSPNLLAAITLYTNETEFMAVTATSLETFDSFSEDTSFFNSPLDFGSFTLSSSSLTQSTLNFIDTPPVATTSNLNGSSSVTVGSESGRGITITFNQPIYAFGATFLDLNDDTIRTNILTPVGNIGPNVQAPLAIRFFGFVSDQPFDTLELRAITADNYAFDNMRFGSSIPEPTSLTLITLGTISLFRRKRSKIKSR